ncbi:MAG: LamG-like jellyroll fold domain-containing protein [Candidatus Paceibacterota bacterium]|jgi:hypothetical protein
MDNLPEKQLNNLARKLDNLEEKFAEKMVDIKDEIQEVSAETKERDFLLHDKEEEKISNVKLDVKSVKTDVLGVKSDVKEIKYDIEKIEKANRTLFKMFASLHKKLMEKSPWYYKWHLKPYSNKVHWITFFTYLVALILVIFINVYYVPQAVTHATTGVAKMINYQGKLTNASNIPVADGSYNVKVAVYDSESGGSCLWTWKGSCGTPTAVPVTVTNGLFNVLLGDTSYQTTNALTLDFNTDSYFLGVTVGADAEMTLRKRIGAVGYAYNSDTVDGKNATDMALLAGVSGGQTLIGGTVANNTLLLQGNSAAAANTASNANIQFKVGDSGGTVAMTLLNSGSVGIGQVSPAAKLEIEVTSAGAVTGLLVDQDDLDQIGLQITQAADATANALDISSYQISGNIIDLSYGGAEVQADSALSGIAIDFTNLTPDNDKALYGININDAASAGAGALEYGLYVQGTNWDYGIYSEDAVLLNTTLTVTTSQTITGSADGTDALTITAGDILVSNGDFDLSGGDFNVTLDAGDQMNLLSSTTTSVAPFAISATTAAAHTGAIATLFIDTTLTNYADDGVADLREGLNISITNNTTDAGADDTISGIRVQNLLGTNNADGLELGIYQAGTSWDYGLYLEDAAYFGTTLNILESTGATYKTIIQGGDQAADLTYTLPTAYPGVSGYVLSATTGGVMSWVATSAGTITAVGSMSSGAAFNDATADDDWLGLGASAGRIEFDDQSTDEINFLSSSIGINTSTPGAKLDILMNATASTSNKKLLNGTQSSTFNTTGGALFSYGAYFNNTSTISSGGNSLTNISMYLSASGATNNYALIVDQGYVGIGTGTPTAPLSVAEKFLVDINGNLTKINNVAYSWPGSQGGASTVLTNDGSGNLTWTTPVTSVSGKGQFSNLKTNNYQTDSYTKLLIQANGADATTGFYDSSLSNKAVTAIQQAQIDTAQSKFGGSSALFDGNTDYLYTPDSADWYWGTGDFTVDTWIRFNALPSVGTGEMIFSDGTDVSNNYNYFGLLNSAGAYQWTFAVQLGGVNTIAIIKNTTVTTGTWYHIALVRNGNNWLIFQDGTQVGTTAVDADPSPDYTGNKFIGIHWNGGHSLNGWIDEFRISKGIARWTTNFTSPVAKYNSSGDEIAITANSLVVANTSNSLVELFDVNLTSIDIMASGANGLDTGAEANAWYYIWVIYNGSTTAGLLSASSTAPTLPGGYTYKTLVGAVYNNGSTNSNFLRYYQNGYKTSYITLLTVLSGGSQTVITAVPLTYSPPIAAETQIFAFAYATGTSGVHYPYISANGINPFLYLATYLSGSYRFQDTQSFSIPMAVSQTMYYWFDTADGLLDLNVSGFTLNL